MPCWPGGGRIVARPADHDRFDRAADIIAVQLQAGIGEHLPTLEQHVIAGGEGLAVYPGDVSPRPVRASVVGIVAARTEVVVCSPKGAGEQQQDDEAHGRQAVTASTLDNLTYDHATGIVGGQHGAIGSAEPKTEHHGLFLQAQVGSMIGPAGQRFTR